MKEIKIGDRVWAGVGDDYDTGRVDDIRDGIATVAWNSLVVTPPRRVDDLETIGRLPVGSRGN